MIPLRPGEHVGDYVLTDTIGRGGMGAVYAARHRETGIVRAVKVLGHDTGGLRGEVKRERFAREARALAKLDRHPNVVGVHDYGVLDDGRGYCVLDYVDGGDLDALLAGGELKVSEVLALGAGIARALEHIHARGVVHRDLKPGNVLLSAEDRRPILTDFGIARDDAEERLTRTQALLGTPHYMSPEQATGDTGRVGPASDVFALGVVLYQMLSGQLPFEGDSTVELTRAILSDEPTPLSASREDLPRGLEVLIRLCLEKESARRPSAARVADSLERLSRGESIELRPPSGLGRFVGRVVDRRVAVGVAVLGLILLGLTARWGQSWIARSRAEEAWRRNAQQEVQDAKDAREAFASWVRVGDGDGTAHLEALVRAELRLAQLLGESELAAEEVRVGVSEELGRVAEALALARVEQALLRGDAGRARTGLAAVARTPQSALARADVALRGGALAEAAIVLGSAPKGHRRNALLARLEGARARAAVKRLAALEVVAGLRRARKLDLSTFSSALRGVVDDVATGWERGASLPRSLTLLEALIGAFGVEALPPGAARLYLAGARESQQRRDYAALTQRLSRAARIDPRLPIPRDLASMLVLEGKDQVRRGNRLQGFALLMHASRSGYETLGKNLLRQLYTSGDLDAAVRRARDDWAPRYWRLRATFATAPELGGFTPKLIARSRADLSALLRRSDLPAWTRVECRLLDLRLYTLAGDVEATLRKARALGEDPAFPDPRRAFEIACAAATQLKDYATAIAMARRHLTALEARAGLKREQVPEGGTMVTAPARHRRQVYERLIRLSLPAGEIEEAQRWLATMARRCPDRYQQHELKALILLHQKRAPEAAAEIEKALAIEPANRHGLRLQARIRARLKRDR